MNQFIRPLLVSAVMALAGCGGSSGSDGDNIVVVNGTFRQLSVVSVSGITDLSCGEPVDRYFETDEVIVLATGDLPDSDYENAAAQVHGQFPRALEAMGLTKAEFQVLRPEYMGINWVIDDIYQSHPQLVDVSWPTGDFWSYQASLTADESARLTSEFQKLFSSYSADEQKEILSRYALLKGYDANEYESSAISEKLYVCLNSSMGGSMSGSGDLLGVSFVPNSVTSRKDYSELILHELIHTIQHQYWYPTNNVYGMDRWFSEGQAVYLSGQSLAKKANGLNPTHIVSFFDETGDPGELYEHYGYAYSYLHKYSGAERIKLMMEDIHNYAGELEFPETKSVPEFEHGFNNNMLKRDGSKLSLEAFKTHYLELVD